MRFCVTIAETSPTRLRTGLDRFSCQADLVEVRLDYLPNREVPELPEKASAEFIATCRPVREGGRFDGSEADRLAILQKAVDVGFDWVDLELDVEAESLRFPEQAKIIRSFHHFESFPEDLPALLQRICAGPADVHKLAVMVADTADLTRLLRFMERLPAGLSRVVLGMGSSGQPSRYLGALLGNEWTYVSRDETSPAAAGQFSLARAETCLARADDEHCPRIYGLLGKPLAHSLSPLLHNHLFREYRKPGVYLPLEIDDARGWFDYVEESRLSFEGFSVTIPLKTAVAEVMDEVQSPVPAVNTVKREGSRWVGYNTDLPGFLEPLRRRTSLSGKTILVLGNGGVAHTVVAALREEGAIVSVTGRNPVRVAQFAQQYSCRSIPISSLPFPADIVVNATPVGQYPEIGESLLSEDQLQCRLVYDLVYHPAVTKLLRMAERKGIETISGIEMFVEQAAHQFRIWTGIEPDRRMIRDLVETALRAE